jgi:DNA helicase-2/ATP-dependent DNA helicase PcrA
VAELHGLAQAMDVRDLFFELMNRTRYLDSASAIVSANVSRLADVIAEFCDRSDDHSLGSYMRHLDLVLLSGEDESPAEVDAAASAVSVMTIHQAKGLEFEVVFVPSLVEGRLPQSGRAMRFQLPPAVLEPLVRGREDVIAEERRLLYVAMTRARRRLYLTRAAHYEGGRRWRDSRFIEEVRRAGVSADRTVPAAAPAEAIPAPSRDGPLTLSFSAIQAYRDCPRQYWFRYEEHLPATQIAEAVQGVILHEVLRRAGELRRGGEEITAPRLHTLHEEVWQATTFPDPRRAPTFRRNGLAQLEAFRASGGFDKAPVLTEEEFKAGVDGFTLHGVIDRVDRTDSGWRIIDYKSGRPVARSRRDLQVALYGIGAAAALDLDPAELEVVYLASGERVVLEGIKELKAQAVAIASGVADGIRSRRFEPQPERRKCRLCPYRLACAEAL